MYVELLWMRIMTRIFHTFFIILIHRDSRALQKTMINNPITDDTENNPESENLNTNNDSIIEDESAANTTNSSTAAVSISVPDSPQIRVVQEVCSEAQEQGYDSDGFLCPEADTEETIVHEETVQDLEPNEAPNDDAEATESTTDNFVFIPEDALVKLKVDELRIELLNRGLSKTGKKAELQEKLRLAMVNRTPLLSIERASAAPNGFKEGARWRLVDPE